MKRVRDFFALTRPKFLPLSVIPVILSASITSRGTQLDYTRLVICLSGVVSLHAASNVANDCYDYILGVDKKTTAGRYSGGSGVLPSGIVSVREAKLLFTLLFLASLLAALWLSIGFSYQPFLLGVLGVLAGLFYTKPPIKLAYRGFGEVTVALTFGPGIMLGTFYVLTGYYGMEVLSMSAVIGGLIGSVLLVNEFRDAKTDLEGGKRTLAVRIKALR